MLNFRKSKESISITSSVQKEANEALHWFDKSVGKARRQRFQKRIDFYYDIQEKYLENDIQSNFQYPSRIKLQKEYDNITRMIVDKQAIMYGKPPARKVMEGTDKDQEIFTNIWDKSKINLVMAEANKMMKLCRNIAVKASWRNDSVHYDIYTPNIFDVIPDPEDSTKPRAIIYCDIVDKENDSNFLNNDKPNTNDDKFDDTDAVFYYWSATGFIRFRRNVKKSKIANIDIFENNPENVNPYGVIPFSFMREAFPTDGFYVQGGDDLIHINGVLNQKITEKNYLTKMQAFSQLVRKGAPEGTPDAISDPSMIFDIPSDNDIDKGADVFYITPDAKIQELADDIKDRKRNIAINRGLDPDMFENSKQRSSAESLQMQNANQAKIIEADKPFYSIYEQDLFEITKTIWNTHNQNNKISEDCYLNIDFGDIEKIMTTEEEDAHNIVMVNNGLMSKVDWIMDVNPDITSREEAMDRLKEIAEENKQLETVGVTSPTEQQAENEDIEE